MKPIQPDAVLGVIVGTKPLPRSAMTKKQVSMVEMTKLVSKHVK